MSQSGAYRDLPSDLEQIGQGHVTHLLWQSAVCAAALYGAAYVLVGQLNAVHGGEDLPQHGHNGFKARHLARLQIFHDFGHSLLDGVQRSFYVGAVALIAQHGQKLPVRRNNRALCQVGNLRGRSGC